MKPSSQIQRTILILFILLFGQINLFAQQNIVLSGFVTTNQNEKLPGVNVYLKGTTTGTVTNEDGYYSLKVTEGENTIVFSFIGYQTQTHRVTPSHPVSGNEKLNITLEPNEALLQEISITSQRKFFGNMDYGRDIPTVKSEEIEKINSTNASDILHARLAGVWATKTSGAPGDQEKIRIRGQASFFSSAEPLYVIDGVPVPIVNLASLGIGDLNMHDIESVTVLKDASSTALYGYQGGNGVVLIDTKQRSENKLEFSYKKGIQWFNNYYDLMNTKDFLESLQLAKANINSSIYKYYPAYSDTLCNHNRQDEIFQMGNLQEYQLSGGGKMKNTTYYLSGNYTKHAGVIKESEQDRINFTARVGTTIKNKLAISGSYRWSYQENLNNQNEYMGNRIIFEGIPKPPCLECTPDSYLYEPGKPDLLNRNQVDYGILNTLSTPKDILDNSFYKYSFYTNAASLMATYKISQELSLNLMESMMFRKSNFQINSIYHKIFYYPGFNVYFVNDTKANVESDEKTILLNHQINLSYNTIIGNHELNLSVANRIYADNISWQVDSLKDAIPSGFYFKNSMAGTSKKGSVIRDIQSYIGHFSYNFNNTYFLSAIANLSRIREGLHINYYTLFPSVSASWDIAKEPLFFGSKLKNQLSLYINYGTSGNYPLNGFGNDLYERSQGWGEFVNTDSTHLIIQQFANHHLKHETNKEFDLGIKCSLFDQRFLLNAAYFSKQIGNQIIQREIPLYYAGGKMFVNLGDIDVSGYEIDFTAIPIHLTDLEWSIQGNFSTSHQEVVRLADGQDMQFISNDILIPDFIIKENTTLGNIYGYKLLGKTNDPDSQLLPNIHYTNFNGYRVQKMDTLNSGLTPSDKTVIGNSIPKFNWNLLSSLTYKEFALDFTIYSVWGMQKFNATRAGTYITGGNRDLNNYFNDSTQLVKQMVFYESSEFVEDAGFIRLKSIFLSYKPFKKIWGFHYEFSVGFENLFTYTRYKGYDPEATIYTDNNFSDNAIDKGAYPSPKSFFATIRITL